MNKIRMIGLVYILIYFGVPLPAQSMAQGQFGQEQLNEHVTLVDDANRIVEITRDQARLFTTIDNIISAIEAAEPINIGFVSVDMIQDLLAINTAVAALPKRYVQYIQNAVNEILHNKSSTYIANLIRAQDYLNFNPNPSFDAVNVLIRALVFVLQGKSLIETTGLLTEFRKVIRWAQELGKPHIIKRAFELGVPQKYEIYLQKHLALGDKPELSIAEYIDLIGGQERIELQYYNLSSVFRLKRDMLFLSKKGITSLDGIQNLLQFSNNMTAQDVTIIDLSKNYILDAERDPDFPKEPFKNFTAVKMINLGANNLRTLSQDMFAIPALQTTELEINVASNSLRVISADAFKGLPRGIKLILNVRENIPLSRYMTPEDPFAGFIKDMNELGIELIIEF